MSPETAKQQVFQYWDYIHKLAGRRFAGDEALQEQAVNYVLDKLAENDWRRVRAYEGKGFTAFLTLTVNRLLTDFARKIGDTPNMPKWLREQGPLWKRAWELLCMKRLGREEVFQTVLDEARGSGHREDYLRELIALVYGKCPLAMRIERLGGGRDIDNEEDEPAWNQRERNFMWIFHVLEQLSLPANGLEQRVQAWIECLRRGIALKDEDYLLLKLVFDEGLSVSEAGRRLQWGTHEVSGRHRRLLQRLRKVLENCGLEKDFWFDED